MRIIFLGINYAPEQTAVGPFNTGLCEALAASGHDVQVVTAFPYYPQWRRQPGYGRRLIARETRRGVRVLRVWHFIPRSPRKLLQRLAHDITYSGLALAVALLTARHIDVVICSSPPPFTPLAAWLVALLHRAPLLVKVTDIASGAASELAILPPGPLRRVARVVEGLGLRRADRVIVLAESFVPQVVALGVRPERVRVIPDWADPAEVAPSDAQSTVRGDVLGEDETQLVLHVGNMGLKQHLATMVDAAGLSDAGTRWLLVGDGEERQALEERACARGAKQLSFLPLQQRERYRELLAAADLLLLVQSASITSQVIPSKLLSYLAAGRPVVASVHADSEVARIVRAACCGVLVPPQDPAALAQAVRELREQPDETRRMGTNARRFAEEHFGSQAVLASYREEIHAWTKPRTRA